MSEAIGSTTSTSRRIKGWWLCASSDWYCTEKELGNGGRETAQKMAYESIVASKMMMDSVSWRSSLDMERGTGLLGEFGGRELV